MRTKTRFGLGLLFVMCLGTEAGAQETAKCWEVDQTGTSVASSIAIEFHTMGTVPDVCDSIQSCPQAGTTCVTPLIPVGPAVSPSDLVTAIVTEINNTCSPGMAIELASGLAFQVIGSVVTGCSVLTGQPGDIPAGMCLPMESCDITNLTDGVSGNEGAAQANGYSLTPVACPSEAPALSPAGFAALLVLIATCGAGGLSWWRHANA